MKDRKRQLHSSEYALAEQRKQLEVLKQFVRQCIKVECWGMPDELDGGYLQDTAEKLGIIVPTLATEADVDALRWYGIEFGDTIYKLADWIQD